MLLAFIQGFGVSGGLIVAIGAQNAFVLSQSIRRNHHLLIALICSLCDAALIVAGVGGMGSVLASQPVLTHAATWGGAIFLIGCGYRAFRSALKGGQLEPDQDISRSLKSVVSITLAVTLLNPHVYLDTVVLLGSISAQIPVGSRWFFGAGAVSASFVWFFTLGLGGQMLAPFFRNRSAWKILDGTVCVTMWAVAASLIHQWVGR